MWDHIINIHSSELLCTKTKDSRIDEHKKFIKKNGQFTFSTNNIITRLFIELTKI